MIAKRIVRRRQHLAHILGLLSQQGVLLSAHANITTFFAPGHRCVEPFEGLLAGDVAHAA
ncbi:MAG: hypothetical protein ACK56F_03650 [bacterium]